MSSNKTIYSKVIARLYINHRFGKGIGNKRINHFIFNGGLEFPDLRVKYWVDLPEFQYLKSSCSITDYPFFSQLAHGIIKDKWKADPYEAERFLVGQMFSLKPKEWVHGLVLFDVSSADSVVLLFDETGAYDEYTKLLVEERFPITPVHKQTETRSPDYFGANFDLDNPQPTKYVAPTSNGIGTSINPNAAVEKYVVKLVSEL